MRMRKMKSNKRIIVLALFGLFFMIIFSGINSIGITEENSAYKEERTEENYYKEEIQLKISGYWNNFSFIHIDGNWTTAAGYEWCKGDGSWGNPYTLENITIDATGSPTGSGILIKFSRNEYFVIKNCTVYNSGDGSGDAGIKLYYTRNGTLIDNICSSNGRSGILLDLLSHNNTVSGNTANDNSFAGIYLEGQNNTISGNTASDNDSYGILLAGQNHTISGNTVNNNYYGIFLHAGSSTISGNTVNNNLNGIIIWGSNNTVSGNTANYNDVYGIALSASNFNTVSGNTANYNDYYGIYIAQSNFNTVSGNTLIENRFGCIFEEAETCTGNIIENNDCVERSDPEVVHGPGIMAIVLLIMFGFAGGALIIIIIYKKRRSLGLNTPLFFNNKFCFLHI